MRMLVLIALALLPLGCTSQSTGERCEQNVDCNTGDICQDYFNAVPCQSSGLSDCICCPQDRAAAALIPACLPHAMTIDSGTSDVASEAAAPEAATDTGTAPGPDASTD